MDSAGVWFIVSTIVSTMGNSLFFLVQWSLEHLGTRIFQCSVKECLSGELFPTADQSNLATYFQPLLQFEGHRCPLQCFNQTCHFYYLYFLHNSVCLQYCGLRQSPPRQECSVWPHLTSPGPLCKGLLPLVFRPT